MFMYKPGCPSYSLGIDFYPRCQIYVRCQNALSSVDCIAKIKASV